MTNHEFRAIRDRLGLTQTQLADVLQYAHAMNISMFERATSPRAIPVHVAMVMRALDSGWRPDNWPKEKTHKAE